MKIFYQFGFSISVSILAYNLTKDFSSTITTFSASACFLSFLDDSFKEIVRAIKK